MLVAILVCLSIDYTYAYFSATHISDAKMTAGAIDLNWKTENSNLSDDNIVTVTTSSLSRGSYQTLKIKNTSGEIGLWISNSSSSNTVPAYCRIKISAKYKTQGSDTWEDCADTTWIKLALTDADTEELVYDTDGKTVVDISRTDYNFTDYRNLWVYKDGYYYCVDEDFELMSISKGKGFMVADYIGLAADMDATLLGASLDITLTVEGIQVTHDMYTTWGLTSTNLSAFA